VFLAARLIHSYRAQAVTLRAQALLLEREREEHARLAAAEERARIARELHDVVAHSVSVMVMHAGAVRRLLHEDQRDERAALEALEQTGRESMSEIRRALGVLRHPSEPAERSPQAGLANLEQLVEQLHGAGLDVALLVDGAPDKVASGVDLAAYRIVQEALTNVVKHAAGARVEVHVRYAPEAVEVEVLDDGGRGSSSDLPPGYGLVGLRERASVLGGTIDAGSRPGGGFRVRATLPLEPVK
jgi:signal transduction histidine kinase